tara:strand:+ start:125 stop:328 length:204 start_codon:yes stop_codon:yes gene_type:complete
MEKIKILCTDNGKTKQADVLSKSDKYLKVVVEGTTMSIEMFRTDLNKPYVGNKAGLEFTYGDGAVTL